MSNVRQRANMPGPSDSSRGSDDVCMNDKKCVRVMSPLHEVRRRVLYYDFRANSANRREKLYLNDKIFVQCFVVFIVV